MAEKSFGVKEINFVGSTPKINSLSNLNLNAVNVAISTNATIGGTLSVTGNVSVGGVLTYEDVTNIDSVGLITARSGIVVKDDATFETANSNNIVFDKSDNALEFGNGVKSVFNNNLQIYNDGNNRFKGSSGGMFFGLPGSFQIGDGNFSNTKFEATGTHAILYSAGVKVARSHENRFEVGNPDVGIGIGATISTIGNAQFVGVVTASSFIGSGANLTGIAVTEAPVTDYTITGDGSHYYFHGGGVDETAGDPDLYLIRGQKYRFNNTTGSSHPFEFRAVSNGSPYTNGVTGDDEGVQFFTVPYDAPAKIFYICTVHSGMVGNIYIRGAGGQNDNIGVTTFTGRVTISSAAPNLLFTETDANPDWGILCSAGQMKFQDMTNVANILTLDDNKIQAVKNLDAMAGVDVTGKIGVNVTSPTTNLQIGDGTVDSDNIIKLGKRVTSNEGNLPLIGHHCDNGTSSGLGLCATSSSGCIHFFTGNDADGFGDGSNEERLRIDSNGLMGLGVTPTSHNNTTAFQIYDDYNSVGYPRIRLTNQSSGTASSDGYEIILNGSDLDAVHRLRENADIYFMTNNTERLRIMSDGKVGIGITNPSAKLEVRDSASTGIIVRSTSTQTSDTNKALRVRNNSDTNTLSVSHKGLLEIARGELGTYLKVGGDDASNGRALTFTSSNTTSNGALHTLNATSGNGAIALATTGTEHFRVDRDGYVTKPNNAMFKAMRTSNQSVSSSGWHTIQFNTDTATGCFDVGSNFNTSNHRFTAPVTGYYQFGLNMRIDGGNGDYYRVAFSLNGDVGSSNNYPYGMAIYKDSDGFNYYSFSITSLIYLTAGQYVRAEAYSSSDTSWTLQDESIFYGYLVG